MTKVDTLKKGKAKPERASTKMMKRQFVENFFKLTGNISQLCKQIGISRQAYYDWMDKDKNFKQVIDNELEGLIDFVESKAFNLINEKNPTMIIFFLKTRAKHRGYVERQEFEHSGTIRADLSISDLKESIKNYEDGKDKQ